MKMRRLLSVLLAVVMVMSCLGVVATSAANSDTAEVAADVSVTPVAAGGSAYKDMLAQTTAANKYGLSDTVDDGTMLQAFTWSFANIEKNLEKIAEQGFTTIQVSPPNEIKAATNNATFLQSNNANGWWMYYQPAGFQINESTDNALGTKSQFVSMCKKAHELGLKIIVDAVINHMGTADNDDKNTSTDPMTHVTPKAKIFEPEIYNNKLFHSPWKQMQYIESNNTRYNSTYDLTRNCTSGLPDLKTEDARVQAAIYDYMEELVQAGADGFRFDAAKHIETPDDISPLNSDFWPNTLVKVQKAHPEKEIYAYGEILNTCGIERPFSSYTKFFDVTDSGAYWGIKDAATGGGGNATPYYPSSNFTAKNTVLWDESHDTYIDGSTTALTTQQRGKIWALVAGRKDISCIYLARPDDATNTNALYNIKIGEARQTSWSNATTKAINQFHNYFIGESEYCTANSGGTAYIERGTKGAMIVTLGGTYGKTVTLTNHQLEDGTYIDAITGNEFTVANKQIKGTVGNTGVACIYENNYVETYIVGDVDEDGDVDAVDATRIQRYAIGVTDFNEKQLLAGDVDSDGLVTVIDATFILRYDAKINVKYPIGKEMAVDQNKPNPNPNPNPQPTTPTPDPTTPPLPGDTITVYFTDALSWGNINVYYWNDGPDWPGEPMQMSEMNGYGQQVYAASIPADVEGIIFNGNGNQTENIESGFYDGAQWYTTGDKDGDNFKVKQVGDEPDPGPGPTPGTGGYYLVGSMNNWSPSAEYQLTKNDSADSDEYMIFGVTLSASDMFKVAYSADGSTIDDNTGWFPGGMDNAYNQNGGMLAGGSYDIYFRPNYDGGSDWFSSCIYVDGDVPTPPQPDPPVGGGSDITFVPGGASAADPAWFAWVWMNGSDGTWIKGTNSGTNVIFAGAGNYDNIIILRMPAGSAAADWDKCWNRTDDYPIEKGKTLYFNDWVSGSNYFTLAWK